MSDQLYFQSSVLCMEAFKPAFPSLQVCEVEQEPPAVPHLPPQSGWFMVVSHSAGNQH